MLEIKNATISVEGRKLVDGLSFAANDCETLCIVGRKGAGKTTLLRALMGLHSLDAGHVSIDGELLSQASAVEFRRQLISYVPQSPLLDSGTVGEFATMLYGIKANKNKPLPKTLLLEEWQKLGLEAEVYDRLMRELTMGERQRVLLGIVCMQNKPIVLADEPGTGLDGQELSLVVSYLRGRAERGQTVVVTSGDEAFGDACHRHINI